MNISPIDSYELKKRKLELVPPNRRLSVLDALSRNETVDVTIPQEIQNDPFIPALTELIKNKHIDLRKYENLYYLVNRKVVPLCQMLQRDVYEPYRKHAATIRKLNQENNGFSDGHTLRHIAAFPPDFYHVLTEQYPNPDERNLVVEWILRTEEGKPYATVEKGI